ncbi:hypothetical protein KI387_010685, partial [Taxus chinensis]
VDVVHGDMEISDANRSELVDCYQYGTFGMKGGGVFLTEGEGCTIGICPNYSTLGGPFGQEDVENSNFQHCFHEVGGPVSSCTSSGMFHSQTGGDKVKDGCKLVDDVEGMLEVVLVRNDNDSN